jgi:GntR family transcriptional regulator
MDSVPFEIHPVSGVPIYRQLIDQVHALIASGQLAPGDLLPSVRSVAQSASVNPMTVSKAYSRLEAEGVVTRVRGQGMQVAPPATDGRLSQRKEQFRQFVEPAVHRAAQLGLTRQQVLEVIQSLLKELPS